MNQKRNYFKANQSWRKEDSDLEDDSLDLEDEDALVVEELRGLLKQLLDECVKLNTQLRQMQQGTMHT